MAGDYRVRVLLGGCPGSTDRGYLGWSAVLLVEVAGRHVVFDTAGYNERHALLSRLAQHGLAAVDVNLVVLSHLHFDHAANWDLFPRAEIVVAARELDYARSEADSAVLRREAAPLLACPRLRSAGGDMELVAGAEVLRAAGHTPGSIALALDRVVLCGDALKDRWELAAAQAVPAGQRSAAQATAVRLAERADVLYPGHDVPLVRTDSGWSPIGRPQVALRFPDGSETIAGPAHAE